VNRVNRHLFGGVVTVGLASIIVCAFILSFSVPSLAERTASESIFHFTANAYEGTTLSGTYASPAGDDYHMDDLISAPEGAATVYTFGVGDHLHFWSDDYDYSGSFIDIPDADAESWTVKLTTGAKVANLDVVIRITLADGSPHSPALVVSKNIAASKNSLNTVTFSYPEYFTGDWQTDEDGGRVGVQKLLYHDTTMHRIQVDFEGFAGAVAIKYGTGNEGSLTTGVVVPENLLGFLFLAPFIPITAKAIVRRLKREKLLATHEGERRRKR
jgi:hypothetical protein